MISNDPTHQLRWIQIGLERKIHVIKEIIRDKRRKTPRRNTRTLEKLNHWENSIEYIESKLTDIEGTLGPKLEEELGIDFKDNELLQIAMFQPSTKNIFLEIETEYRYDRNCPLSRQDFENLVNVPEMAQALALVGDAAIDMSVLHHLWEPTAADVGMLTQRRADIVSNEHLADVCNSWGLYEYRIHFDPSHPSTAEMQHDKGTLLEAVYGIIYVEYGFEAVEREITHILR
ncbi:MAG: ribonuclease III domain-containing protein [Candidatus Thorarchaeota archaeon]